VKDFSVTAFLRNDTREGMARVARWSNIPPAPFTKGVRKGGMTGLRSKELRDKAG